MTDQDQATASGRESPPSWWRTFPWAGWTLPLLGWTGFWLWEHLLMPALLAWTIYVLAVAFYWFGFTRATDIAHGIDA